MTKAIDVVKAHKSTEKSLWKEQAQWHVDNWDWLKHSTQIALAARRRMVSLGLTQKDLAERMGCSQQYVSLILKGKENLTLETISRIEKVLDFDLLIHPQNYVDGYIIPANGQKHYLNDSSEDLSEAEIKTSKLVNGYKTKKK